MKKLGKKTISAVVLSEKDNLSEKDCALINISENLHRKDVSPFELGRICSWLKKEGMSSPEIGARLSMSKTKVQRSIGLYEMSIPEEEKKNVVYMDERRVGSKRSTKTGYPGCSCCGF